MTLDDPTTYATLQRVHGHVAVLGLAVLLHPVVALRRGRRPTWRTRLTADLGALLLATPFWLGWALYPIYRTRVKPGLLATQHDLAMAFESKEHLAAFATALAVSGALTLRLSHRRPGGVRTARALLAGAWLCGLLAALLGIAVAAGAAPAW